MPAQASTPVDKWLNCLDIKETLVPTGKHVTLEMMKNGITFFNSFYSNKCVTDTK